MLKVGIIKNHNAYIILDGHGKEAKVITFVGDKVNRSILSIEDAADLLELVDRWYDLDNSPEYKLLDYQDDGTIYILTIDTYTKDISRRVWREEYNSYF